MKEEKINYEEIRNKEGYESSCISDARGMQVREKRLYEALEKQILDKERRDEMSDSAVLKYLQLKIKYDNKKYENDNKTSKK